MSDYIRLSKDGNIGTILLNDPSKRNALSQPMAAQLKAALDDLRFDDAVRVIIIRGAGGFFCAGGDITGMKKRVDAYSRGEKAETETKINMRNLNEVVLRIRETEKPVIAWIEGACAGGGMSLAMACDFSFADETAKMSFSFSSIGLGPDMGSSVMLTRRAGAVRATDLFMTGRRFSAGQAAEWNIITEAVPGELLENKVYETARHLAAGAACTYKVVKEAVNRNAYKDLYENMEIEAGEQDMLTHTKDHAEGVLAFLEKRKPFFTGR